MNEFPSLATLFTGLSQLDQGIVTTLIGAGATLAGVKLKSYLDRHGVNARLKLVVAQTELAKTQELVQVVEALRIQIEVFRNENARLREELVGARSEINRLSAKLDRLEVWITGLPEEIRTNCPMWTTGEPCPLLNSLEARAGTTVP